MHPILNDMNQYKYIQTYFLAFNRSCLCPLGGLGGFTSLAGGSNSHTLHTHAHTQSTRVYSDAIHIIQFNLSEHIHFNQESLHSEGMT